MSVSRRVPGWALVLALPALTTLPAVSQPASAVRPGPGLLAPMLPAVRALPPAGAAARPASDAVLAASHRPRPPVRAAVSPPPLPQDRPDLEDNGETLDQITPGAANARPTRFPIGRGHEGPSVLHVQVLLDRALFSPGMIDGKWGRNTEVAVYWLQAREGLAPTGYVDEETYRRLYRLAGRPTEVVRAHELTVEDVRGPFVTLPGSVYAQARLGCSCYESLTEKLTELFHLRTELLRRLNPGVALHRLATGSRLHVPAVRSADAPPAGEVAELWISGQQNFLQAVDAQGRILYHFPTTLGSSYDPSPQGDFFVRSIHPDPWWHYQPRILAHVPDHRPEARVPPGPNNAVGRVWMSLSVPHYGIHGTKSPETIGYATSAGCVRLTNWDVVFLSGRVAPGTPVRFRDTRRAQPAAAPAAAAAATAEAPRGPARPALLGVRADSARPGPAAAPQPAAEPAATAPEPAATPPTPQPADTTRS